MKQLSGDDLTNYVKEMAEYLQTKYSGRNALIEDVRRRRFLEQEPYVPTPYKVTPTVFKSGYVFDTTHRLASIMSAARPRPKVIPRNPGAEAQEISTEWEKWLGAAYENMDENGKQFYKEVDSLGSDGRAVCKLSLDIHSWAVQREEGEGDKKYNDRVAETHRNHFPFVKDFVPTSEFYPTKQGGKVIEVLEIVKREARPIAEQYGLYASKDGKLTRVGDRGEGKFPYLCNWVEYWNDNQYAYFVDGELVEGGTHEYKRPPYFEALGLITSSSDPTYEALPLVYPLLEIQDLVDSITSIRINWAYWTAFAQFIEQPLSEEAVPIDRKAKPKVVRLGMGQVYEPRPGYRLEVLKFPPVGQELEAMHRWAKQYAEELSLAPILKGVAPGADVSNAAALTMIAAAKSVLSPAMDNTAQYYDRQAEFIQENLARLNDEVPAWMPLKDKKGRYTGEGAEYVIKPSRHLNGRYIVKHHLEPVIPAEGYTKTIMLSDSQSRGLVDKNYVREEGIGIDNPEEMQLKVDLEKAREAPQYQQALWEEFAAWRQGKQPGPPPAPPGLGTPASLPIGPGGPGVPMVAGVQQPVQPGGPMPARPPVPGM